MVASGRDHVAAVGDFLVADGREDCFFLPTFRKGLECNSSIFHLLEVTHAVYLKLCLPENVDAVRTGLIMLPLWVAE